MLTSQRLSVVIPAYNEAATLGTLLDLLLGLDLSGIGVSMELIVVNDGSTDETPAILDSFGDKIRILHQANQGKGKAVQHGIQHSSGDWILVQDADMEYDPLDYTALLETLFAQENPRQCAIYGSRILGQIQRHGLGFFPGRHPQQGFGPWLAGALLTLYCLMLYQRWITDTLTAYKLYPKTIFESWEIKTCGFETDHEITAKLIRHGYKILEVPIAYMPRTTEEGKKIGWADGVKAVWTLLRFRFFT